ncbi:MAG: hypothetical protein K0U47_02655 [Epsilonproteobacteria bacterium]|nr:hypothetical protein [Campylobacterota bacterium]
MRVAATRLHTSNESIPIDLEKLTHWCEHVLHYCDLLIVVVDQRYFDTAGKMLMSFGEKIKVFHIHPWISYTQPLNMLVEKALSVGAKELLFQSIEVEISIEDMLTLERYLDEDTLVVGAKLLDRHGHQDEVCTIDGWTTPWNTLALWNINKLGLTGFLSISSGNLPQIPGGVEEVVTISLLQHLKPQQMQAKIIDLPSVIWQTQWACEDREKYHEQKMASKDERSQIQLKALGIQAGTVHMINTTKGRI